MKTISFLTEYWHFNLVAAVTIVVLLIFHYQTNDRRFSARSLVFLAGILLIIIATFSPLDYLSKNALFSAHMTQHILALLVIPPVLLAGTSRRYLNHLGQREWFRKSSNVIFHPVFAWMAGVGSMWVSHIPGLMMKMKDSEAVMDLQTVILLILGTIFIWPVFTPVRIKKLDPLQSSIYLFLACVGCTTLGILITFAPSGLFTSEMTDMDMNIVTMIRSNWGITVDMDQQIGGLIMWVPACLIYLSYVMITLFRWLSYQNAAEKATQEINSGEPVNTDYGKQ
jgi:putative membrane protein